MTNARDYALGLIDEGSLNARDFAIMCVKFMSLNDVEKMLDANELSERFTEEEELSDEEVEDMLNNFNYVGSRHHY